MNTIILTSYSDFYEKHEQENKIAHNFGNDNGILDCLKSNIKNMTTLYLLPMEWKGKKLKHILSWLATHLS